MVDVFGCCWIKLNSFYKILMWGRVSFFKFVGRFIVVVWCGVFSNRWMVEFISDG